MKITLTKAQRNLTKACATGDDRPVLTCLAVGKGHVVGADGFMLATMRHTFKGKYVLFPVQYLKAFNKCKGDVEFAVGPHYISGSDEQHVITVDRRNINGMYPKWQVVFQQLAEVPQQAQIALNADLLRRATEIVSKSCTCGKIMRCYVSDESHAVRITAEAQDGTSTDDDKLPEITMAVMPMLFVDWSK